MTASAPLIPRHERKLALLFCFIAAVRVFIFSAAFPFFNNVDEQAHVDLVMKYARGDVPRSLENFSSESAAYFALHSSPEYFAAPEQFPTGAIPPPNWTLPADQRDKALGMIRSQWESQQNHESQEPPLYYAIAGAWLNVGRAFGLRGASSLYWIRFFNTFIAAILVWVGFSATRLVFPDRLSIRLAVPLLVAVWPQSSFYSVQSDVLSPLCFGLAFVGLIKFLDAERPVLPLALATGLALAATCFVKISNLPLLAVAFNVVLFKVQPLARSRRLELAPLVALIVATSLPLVVWFGWNLHTFGDVTATTGKIELLGWTRKPIATWLPHPIFSSHGIKEFWPELMAGFWRGELIWHGRRLASASSDAFYWISSTLALVFAAASLISPPGNLHHRQRRQLWLALLSFTVLLVFVVLLSISFDYGICIYPSRDHPYFTSGRLLSAAAVPFFLLYAWMMDSLFSRIPRFRRPMLPFAVLALFIVVSQTIVNWLVFSSRYNFFHLPVS